MRADNWRGSEWSEPAADWRRRSGGRVHCSKSPSKFHQVSGAWRSS